MHISIFLHRYIITFKVDWSTLEKPIFLNKKGKTFSDWIKTFTGYLISKVKIGHHGDWMSVYWGLFRFNTKDLYLMMGLNLVLWQIRISLQSAGLQYKQVLLSSHSCSLAYCSEIRWISPEIYMERKTTCRER